MALLRRQAVSLEVFDDQSPTLWNSFVGNWTHYSSADGFQNETVTATPNPGASLSFTFSGSQAWLYGGLLNITSANGEIVSYPTADYRIDGTSAGSQKPWLDGNAVVYFQTPKLADGTHRIDVVVTTANSTNQYIIDCFLITPTAGGANSGVGTSRSVPTPTSTPSTVPITTTTSTPIGAIVGGVVGGIAGIAILAVALWYFLRKKTRGNQAYYFDKPTPADVLAGEERIEPFNANATTPAPSSPGFTGPGPQSAYSDGSSNQPLNRQTFVSTLPSQYSQSDPSTPGMTHVTNTMAQPRTGKAALIAQQHQNVQQPVQLEDSGIRFNETGEREAGPSQPPAEIPPSYTPR